VVGRPTHRSICNRANGRKTRQWYRRVRCQRCWRSWRVTPVACCSWMKLTRAALSASRRRDIRSFQHPAARGDRSRNQPVDHDDVFKVRRVSRRRHQQSLSRLYQTVEHSAKFDLHGFGAAANYGGCFGKYSRGATTLRIGANATKQHSLFVRHLIESYGMWVSPVWFIAGPRL